MGAEDPKIPVSLDRLAHHLDHGEDALAVAAAADLLALLMGQHLSPNLNGVDITLVQEGLRVIARRMGAEPI